MLRQLSKYQNVDAQKKYARSETHVSELLDGVCEKLSSDYVETKVDGKKRFFAACLQYFVNGLPSYKITAII